MPSLSRLSAASAAVLFAVAGLAAQPEPGTKGPPAPSRAPTPIPVGEKGPPRPEAAPREPEATFDLDFKGGTIAEYVALLRAMPGVRVNVALAEEAEGLPLGQVVLKQATFDSAIQAVETARLVSGGETTHARLQHQNGMFLVNVSKTANQNQTGGNPFERTSEIAVFNLSGASAPTVPAEVVLSAVEAAVKMVARPGEEPRISYHKESGLLLVMGNDRVQDAVRSVYRSVGERREATATKAMIDGSKELFALLNATDMSVAIARVKELLDTRQSAEHARALWATGEAKLMTQVKMGEEEITRLHQRLEKMEDKLQISEASARDIAANLKKHNSDLADANGKLSEELNQTREALKQAQAKLQESGTKR